MSRPRAITLAAIVPIVTHSVWLLVSRWWWVRTGRHAGAFYTVGDFASLTISLGIGATLLWRSRNSRLEGVSSVIGYVLLGILVLVLLTVEILGLVFDEWL